MILGKKKELITLLEGYKDKKSSLNDLQKFAEEILDFFSDRKNKLPSKKKFEKEFWYAIWQIQHVADAEHEKEGITFQELSNALDFLVGNKKIPSSYIGDRP